MILSTVALLFSVIADKIMLELETASPEVKRYNRQKVTIVFATTIVSLAWLAMLGGLGWMCARLMSL